MKTLILLSCIFFSLNSLSQDKFLETEKDVESFCQDVTELFMKSKISRMVRLLKPYWPINEDEIEQFTEQTTQMVDLMGERYGEPFSYSFIRDERILDFALKKTYFLRFDNIAIRIIFTFYKNPKGWIVNGFKWDDDFEEEFR
jgi:hypothetical protein